MRLHLEPPTRLPHHVICQKGGAIVLAGGMKGKTFDFLPPHVQLEFIIYGLAVRWIRK